MEEKEIGKVIHYFDKAMVGVIKLEGPLAVGDEIKVRHGDQEFSQTVDSMEIDHKKISSAKKGNEVAVKFVKESHAHALVFKA